MRSTVLVLDSLVYIPALLMFIKTWQESRSRRTQVHPFIKLDRRLFNWRVGRIWLYWFFYSNLHYFSSTSDISNITQSC
jgi:hypothetical protein